MPRLRFSAAAVAAALLATPAFAADATPDAGPPQWVFFGTYTVGKGLESKGIYRSRFDPAAGTLTEPELAAEVAQPTFLAVHPTRKYLYAIGEVNAVGGVKGGGVHAFGLDSATGKLTPLNSASSVGPGPCHVVVNPAGNMIAVANYGGGSSVFYKLADDGKIGDKVAFFQHAREGDAKPGQKPPHAHCSAFLPDGKFALVNDLGLDRVKVFAVDAAAGKVDDAPADIVLPPNAGPRHVALTPAADFAYVCGELDSTVNVVKLDPATGKGEVVQSLSTLPKPVKGNSTAEVVRHPSGKFVYVSNRGHNSVAAFKVGDDAKLTAAGHITGDIKVPRNFNVDPSGRWMLIASQNGDKVGVWELNPETGLGKETGRTVAVGRPVCVKFVPVAK